MILKTHGAVRIKARLTRCARSPTSVRFPLSPAPAHAGVALPPHVGRCRCRGGRSGGASRPGPLAKETGEGMHQGQSVQKGHGLARSRVQTTCVVTDVTPNGLGREEWVGPKPMAVDSERLPQFVIDARSPKEGRISVGHLRWRHRRRLVEATSRLVVDHGRLRSPQRGTPRSDTGIAVRHGLSRPMTAVDRRADHRPSWVDPTLMGIFYN